MNSNIENVLGKLSGVKRVGEGWSAQCPNHDDRRASLSLGIGDDGRILLHCHAGCAAEGVLAAMGLTMRDLMPPEPAKPLNGKPKIIATYPYRDEDGTVLFEVVRFDPKDFRQRRPDGKGGYVWSVKGVRTVPYRLPELLAKPSALVIVPEGEKDCDNLAKIGYVATCNAGGAGKWTAEHAKHLNGRSVAVIPDKDVAGRRHAERVARSLVGIVASIKIVELPGPGKDVSDWLAAGGTKEQLAELIAAAPEIEPIRTVQSACVGNGTPRHPHIVRRSTSIDRDIPSPSGIEDHLARIPNLIAAGGAAAFFADQEILGELAFLSVVDPARFASVKAGLPKTISRRDLDKALRPIVDRLRPHHQSAVQSGGEYRVTNGRIVRVAMTREGPVDVPLCNFNAQIVEQVIHDDGSAERQISLSLEGQLADGELLPRIEVSAERFPVMDWPLKAWGTKPVVYAGSGTKDHLRAAIQLRSGEVPERTVYGHTGWRKIGDSHYFLHAGGAIGVAGSAGGIDVALPESLSRFDLPAPPMGQPLIDAVRASLGLLYGLAPDRIIFPLVASIYRAVLGGSDFSSFVAGPTGAQKTELAALVQQHFGAGMDSRNLPCSWSSTGNALEGIAFAAKDVELVVDDFAPTGSTADVQRFHREADRLLRAQGNHSGRQRMRADGSLRPTKPPRGLILATGEDVPRGESLRGRLFVSEIDKGDVNLAILTRCQEAARNGLYAASLAGYLRWLAPKIEKVRDKLRNEVTAIRDRFFRADGTFHARTPGIVADLALGIRYFLGFAAEIGAISLEEHDQLWQRGWAALREAAEAHVPFQQAAEPAQQFLRLLAAVISSGRAHVTGPEGEEPANPNCWGWRETTIVGELGSKDVWRSQGNRIGWLDGNDLFLEPEAGFAQAQRLASEQGDTLSVSPHTLRKRLHEKGLLLTIDEKRKTLTTRRVLQGQRRAVLHLSTSCLEEQADLTSLSANDCDRVTTVLPAWSDRWSKNPAFASTLTTEPTTASRSTNEANGELVSLVSSDCTRESAAYQKEIAEVEEGEI